MTFLNNSEYLSKEKKEIAYAFKEQFPPFAFSFTSFLSLKWFKNSSVYDQCFKVRNGR